MSQSLLIVAGETSGDTVGGLFATELKLLKPELELFGIGGDNMDIAGVEIRYHVRQLSVLGFWEVLKRLSFIRQVEKDLVDQIKKRRPSLAVLIDYPGFNLRLARKLKSMGIPIMYYVSPQVWAWGKGRIARIRKLVDKIVVVFQFEKELYARAGVAAEWHGHPLLEVAHSRLQRGEFLAKIGLRNEQRYVGLLPGSRQQEVERILPVMRDALLALRASGRSFPGVVGCAPGIDDALYRRHGHSGLLFTRGLNYDLMRHAELNLVASGTATLECAILAAPLFVLYKTSPITYLIAKRLVKIPYVGLVNVVAGEKVVPEFIQQRCHANIISIEMRRFFEDEDCRRAMLENLASVRAKLGQAGASRKAAETALRMMDNSPG